MTKTNWMVDEARKADGARGYVILEDPRSKRQLEDLLVTGVWPFIRSRLQETGYTFHKRVPTEFELGVTHERSLGFMLFEGRRIFFRGTLKCSREAWMVESEFFLALKKQNDPQVIFELLGNSRLCGMPPVLSVHKGDDYYFQILFQNGRGAGWGLGDENDVKQRIEKVIHTNVKMHELAQGGFISPLMLGRFLTTTYEVYEAY